MELQLGLKITRTKDDDQTSTDFRITKDQTGLLFFSRETETMFILTVHLKGFKREKIKVDINEDGTLITIYAEKQNQEMVMVGWTMRKKGIEICSLKKVFRIPDGVVLDGVKAKFNEEQSVLTIQIPKSVKGIKGVGIEEVKEKIDTLMDYEVQKQNYDVKNEIHEEIEKETSFEDPSNIIQQPYESIKQAPAQDKEEKTEIQPRELANVEEEKNGQNSETEIQMQNHDLGDKEEIKEEAENRLAGQEFEQARPLPGLPVDQETKNEEMIMKNDQEKHLNEEKVQTDESSDAEKQKSIRDQADETNGNDRSELFGSCFYAGSAFLITLIVLAVHFIRGKNR